MRPICSHSHSQDIAAPRSAAEFGSGELNTGVNLNDGTPIASFGGIERTRAESRFTIARSEELSASGL
jgi:hypothetical protein